MSHSHRIHDDHDHVEPEIYVNSRRVRVSYALLTGISARSAIVACRYVSQRVGDMLVGFVLLFCYTALLASPRHFLRHHLGSVDPGVRSQPERDRSE